ncbi:MAG: ATP-binding protein [Syntrophales bacterium]|nr:ATP-binding protein [Syntrophales bacterium]
MNRGLTDSDELARRGINYLIFFRFLVLAFLLGVVVILVRQIEGGLAEVYPFYYYLVITLSLLLNFIAWLINKGKISPFIHLYLHISFDLIAITFMVYLTGGINSIYPVLYQLVIIYAVFFLGKIGGLYSASGASILYGVLIDAEYLQIIPSFTSQATEGSVTAGFVLFRLCLYILSYYITAALAIFVVERERRTARLLKESERAFSDLSRLYQSIIESVSTGIITVDKRGLIKTFNRAAGLITGLKREEVINRPINEILKDLPNTNAGEGRGEIHHLTRNGKHLILGYSCSPLKNERDEEIGEIILLRDLTDIRLMQEEAKKNERLAFIGQMAANLAHEFRNPLMSMSGSIQMLKRTLPLGEEERRLMDIIARARDRLEAVIGDFLLLSRQKRREVEELSLSPLLEELIDRVRKEGDGAKEIDFNIEADQNITFKGNRDELRHLVYNLLLNAVQAVGEKGKIKVSAKYVSKNSQNAVEIAVEDNGMGIPREEINHIFEPFYTTKDKGTGLGLSIVSTIVQTYGGTIEVDSNPGISTKFTVTLPYQQ